MIGDVSKSHVSASVDLACRYKNKEVITFSSFPPHQTCSVSPIFTRYTAEQNQGIGQLLDHKLTVTSLWPLPYPVNTQQWLSSFVLRLSKEHWKGRK